jgi:hypothetical protein
MMDLLFTPALINFLQHLAAFILIAIDTAGMFRVIEFKAPPVPGAPKLGEIPELK